MSNSHPYDDEPDDRDFDNTPPPAAQLAEEPDTVPAPAPRTVSSRLPVPRARRELKAELEDAKVAMANLKMLELGEDVNLDPVAIDALVCSFTDASFPLDDSLPHIDRWREKARNGDLKTHVSLAMDEIEDVICTLDAALVALKACSALDEPIPAIWGNLSPVDLARKLNQLGHVLLRGRIAGMAL